ncbi:tetratricopeptide repeat-containing sulfotransferase family protein [Tsuneonella mangrovi]|uniref:tetratricopeptide repeat-containing sulfotransferase family protein n=1 Tax=Tsuneonella mangrovi TaxID=1982042 RepID=UPI000BA29885|nr:sulfotransferase [Tsuneonella mangrovi]
MTAPKSRILDAIAALEAGDRRRAASLIRIELREGAKTGDRWASVYRLASQIGEIDLGLEASHRHAMTEPLLLNRLLTHCGALAQVGRSTDALALLDRLPSQAQSYPAVVHFRGTVASESGDLARAEAIFRQLLEISPASPEGWFALAMIKRFEPGDPDFPAMAAIERQIQAADPLSRARFHYAMGKALVDMGEIDRGFAYYEKGASIRQAQEPYDRIAQERFTDRVVADFTLDQLNRLKASRFKSQRAIFVHGFPRSGTTLVESILVEHSHVSDGAEINLFKAALIPTYDRTFDGAMRYESGAPGADPWGEIATDYHRMLGQRFPGKGMVVDKTLLQSPFMGLLLHAMPQAKVPWLRRRPEDVALSAYRTYFTTPMPWSWSLGDIAHMMQQEDRLFAHWMALFPDRILPVPYEELVRDPDAWIPRILDHVGLEFEAGLDKFHANRRQVRTASVQQVRAGISTVAVGSAGRYAAQMAPFRDAYYR